MNKYEEALKTIMDETCHIGEVGKPIQVIKELVDKEIPMKPNGLVCSRCGSYVVENTYTGTVKYKRCRNADCGQLIDWEEEDE